MKMASNILSLPFRRTHAASLSEAIKQYISSKYDQHPDMFTKDLETIDQLRTSAINALEPHSSGIRKLQAYAAQLVWVTGKFPVDIGVDFTWYPALGYNTSRPTSQNNLRFELANILYNLAAMYSQLATSTNRSTSEGLKTACNYFCNAAGVLKYTKTDIVPDMRTTPPEDMDNMTLESLENLMLAQAQECFWQKAVKDGLKDASIAKLAASVSDLYSDAGDYAIKSDFISSEWIHHTSAKHHHFAAAAQYRAACDCLEKRKYGEEVARLRDALTCVNDALREQRYINKAVYGDLNGLKNRVTEDLKRAEKDNDMIYLLPVPPKSELRTLDRAKMVDSRVPKEVSESISMLSENGPLGRPLFTKLVPYSVHVAASIYVDRRDRLVNQTIDELEDLTTKIHEVLKSLNLPGSLQALEKPLGLPSSLISHAEEIREKDGLDRLYRSIDETENLKDNDRRTYQEGVDLLRTEAAEDERARRKYGTERWNRSTSEATVPKLFAQIGEIEGYLKSAKNSDSLVHAKLKDNESLIRLLSGTDRDLEKYVPSSRRATMTAAVERESSKLRGCLNDVNRLESRRRRKIEALKAKAKQDDINPDLLKETARLEREYPMQTIEAVQFETIFDERLTQYDVDKKMVQEEELEQQEIIKLLRDTNTAFINARRGDTSTRQREQALQSLENAYFKYKEIISNLDVGRKFYNDLAKIVGRFRDECRNFVYQRRAEAASMES
ncbi:BRO1-domain-containing protein [Patellaria atrata CBS 101060]|uniref:BRO1-domain-containing protein n=1 Tax=Patellaria atrata CBS 101060 TaxID=1346257 RepID=A0A9P4SEB9_9PEZI|nr:BRO1-domain-containing protein [Patellaria atrata CBS 101060]